VDAHAVKGVAEVGLNGAAADFQRDAFPRSAAQPTPTSCFSLPPQELLSFDLKLKLDKSAKAAALKAAALPMVSQKPSEAGHEVAAAAAAPAVEVLCAFTNGQDIKGADSGRGDTDLMPTSSAAQCCGACSKTGAKGFTINSADNGCWCKTRGPSATDLQGDSNLVSGATKCCAVKEPEPKMAAPKAKAAAAPPLDAAAAAVTAKKVEAAATARPAATGGGNHIGAGASKGTKSRPTATDLVHMDPCCLLIS